MTARIAYSAAEVAGLLKLSENRVRELAVRGELPAVRIGGVWRFPVARLDEWAAESQGRVAAVSSGHGRSA